METNIAFSIPNRTCEPGELHEFVFVERGNHFDSLKKITLAPRYINIRSTQHHHVIDALDESDEDEVRDMVSFFEMLGEDAISDGRTLCLARMGSSEVLSDSEARNSDRRAAVFCTKIAASGVLISG
jgi:hypothetical protein